MGHVVGGISKDQKRYAPSNYNILEEILKILK